MEIRDYHLPLNMRKGISEKGLIDEFIEARNNVEINYFILDLVTADYNIENLVYYSNKKHQSNALGYVSDVVEGALPEDLKDIRKKISNLSISLYPFKQDNWEHLSTGLSECGKRLMKLYSTSVVNDKWNIYTNLNEEEVIDWFRVYDDEIYSPQNASKRILVYE